MYNEYPQIGQTLGMDQPLDLEVKFRAPKIEFGPEGGSNVKFHTDVLYGIKKSGEINYLVYDEMRLQTEFDLEISEETLLVNTKELKLVPWGAEH